jgi:hypothetical protein
MEVTQADKSIIAAYQRLIVHLKAMRDSQVDAVFFDSIPLPAPKDLAGVPDRKESDYASLSVESIEAILSDPRTSRAELVSLARYRFGFPSGQLSERKSKAALIDAIRTQLENEKTRAAIRRAASAQVE